MDDTTVFGGSARAIEAGASRQATAAKFEVSVSCVTPAMVRLTGNRS